MHTIELSDPDGDALTITTDTDGVWISCTAEDAEVTVGPLAAATLRDSLARLGGHDRSTRS